MAAFQDGQFSGYYRTPSDRFYPKLHGWLAFQSPEPRISLCQTEKSGCELLKITVEKSGWNRHRVRDRLFIFSFHISWITTNYLLLNLLKILLIFHLCNNHHSSKQVNN